MSKRKKREKSLIETEKDWKRERKKKAESLRTKVKSRKIKESE